MIKPQKPPILLFLVILISFQTYAQPDFRPGYILKTNGDSLRGFVAYRESQSQYTECLFKGSREASSTTFLPKDLYGYGFDKEGYYLAKVLKTESESDLLFAKILVNGRMKLLKIKGALYMEDTKSEIVKLSPESTEVHHEGRNYIRSDESRRKGILIWKMNDYPELRKRIERLRITKSSLIKVFEEYNSHFIQQPVSPKEKRPLATTQLGISMNYTSYKIIKSELYNYYPIDKKRFESAQSYMPGISVLIGSPRISEKLWFHADVFYGYRSHQSVLTVNNSTYYFSEGFHSTNIPAFLSYHFTRYKRKLTPFIEMGVSTTWMIKSESYSFIESVRGNESTITVSDPPILKNDFSFRFTPGIGIKYQLYPKVSILLRGRMGQGLSPMHMVSSADTDRHISGILTLSYSFDK